jgi:hypothetical protein
MMQSQPSSIATRNGVITGVALGILSLPVITLSVIGRAVGLGGGLLALFLLIALVVFAVVAFSVSRYSGLARSGVWAGFLAALITAFIAICLGVVILVLLVSNAAVAAPVARRAGHGAAGYLALGVRLAIVRLALGGLIVLASGLIAGMIGGLLGRIGRPGGRRGQAASYSANASATQAQVYATPMPPAQSYMAGYMPTPQSAPPLYTPTAPPYDESAPTIVRDTPE